MRVLADIVRRSSFGEGSNSTSSKFFWASLYNDSQQRQKQEPLCISSDEETGKIPKSEHEIIVCVTLSILLNQLIDSQDHMGRTRGPLQSLQLATKAEMGSYDPSGNVLLPLTVHVYSGHASLTYDSTGVWHTSRVQGTTYYEHLSARLRPRPLCAGTIVRGFWQSASDADSQPVLSVLQHSMWIREEREPDACFPLPRWTWRSGTTSSKQRLLTPTTFRPSFLAH
jgi:hypothetical protein